MSADLALARIEAILTEIEGLTAAIGIRWRQSEDGEAMQIVTQILDREGKNAA